MRIVILFLFVCIAGFSKAQFSVGPKAGATFSTLSNIDSADLHIGFLGGLVLNYEIIDRVSIQHDILLVQRGLTTENETIKEDHYFAETSVLPKVFLGIKKVKPFVSAGPYFAFLMFGRTHNTINGEETNEAIDLDEQSKSMDFGFNFGFGIQYKGLIAELRSGIGIKDYERFPDSGRHSHRVLSISCAYVFDID